jgi:hypothetical protein
MRTRRPEREYYHSVQLQPLGRDTCSKEVVVTYFRTPVLLSFFHLPFLCLFFPLLLVPYVFSQSKIHLIYACRYATSYRSTACTACIMCSLHTYCSLHLERKPIRKPDRPYVPLCNVRTSISGNEQTTPVSFPAHCYTLCVGRQPFRPHILSDLYQYNFHNSGHYPSSCFLFKTQLNTIGLSVPHRKHITYPLRAQ